MPYQGGPAVGRAWFFSIIVSCVWRRIVSSGGGGLVLLIRGLACSAADRHVGGCRSQVRHSLASELGAQPALSRQYQHQISRQGQVVEIPQVSEAVGRLPAWFRTGENHGGEFRLACIGQDMGAMPLPEALQAQVFQLCFGGFQPEAADQPSPVRQVGHSVRLLALNGAHQGSAVVQPASSRTCRLGC